MQQPQIFEEKKFTDEDAAVILESNRPEVEKFIKTGAGRIDVTNMERAARYMLNEVINFYSMNHAGTANSLRRLYQVYDEKKAKK